MLVYKYYCRPVDQNSERLALDEIARYAQTRDRLVVLKEKWLRIREDQILPEYRELAEVLRAAPRRGRKPVKVRSDHDELSAADKRALYAEFIAAGGSYATWWLADAAAKKAKHQKRDEEAGRAAMLPKRMRWDGAILSYGESAWSVHAKQLTSRPIPEGVEIVQAWLQRERRSAKVSARSRFAWFVVLVMDGISPRKHSVTAERSTAGLDIGWRREDTALRVAYVADDTGAHHEITMLRNRIREDGTVRSGHLERANHANGVRALADQEANRLRSALGTPANTSVRRLVELAPDDPLTKHMLHLIEWHHGASAGVVRSRDEHYRKQIYALCRAHHTIYVEKIKGAGGLVKKKNTRKKADGTYEKAGVARGQRQLAAPFTFLRTLQRISPQFDTRVIEVPAAGTSRFCPSPTCGNYLGASSARERHCGECGGSWDSDYLAALNILALGNACNADSAAAE